MTKASNSPVTYAKAIIPDACSVERSMTTT